MRPKPSISGRAEADLTHQYRYRGSDEGVSIDRVMHGARDLPRRLLEAPESYPPQG